MRGRGGKRKEENKEERVSASMEKRSGMRDSRSKYSLLSFDLPPPPCLQLAPTTTTSDNNKKKDDNQRVNNLLLQSGGGHHTVTCAGRYTGVTVTEYGRSGERGYGGSASLQLLDNHA